MRRGRARALLGALALAGCGAGDSGSGALPEPYVSAVNVSPRSWKPLSAGTLPPERLPGMVMYEITQWAVDRAPTPEQEREARELVERTRETAQRRGWYDFERASADGFGPIAGDPTHFANREFLFDDALLDPARPEVLMYARTNRGRKLAGAMYYVREPAEHGLQVGGPLTLWHYHVWPKGACLLRGMIPVASPDAEGRCSEGEFSRRSPEMLHVWLIDHPQGPFATNMTLPHALLKELLRAEEVEALEHEHGDHAAPAAASADGDPVAHADHSAHGDPAAHADHAGHAGEDADPAKHPGPERPGG